jgi:hypothetical protein
VLKIISCIQISRVLSFHAHISITKSLAQLGETGTVHNFKNCELARFAVACARSSAFDDFEQRAYIVTTIAAMEQKIRIEASANIDAQILRSFCTFPREITFAPCFLRISLCIK